MMTTSVKYREKAHNLLCLKKFKSFLFNGQVIVT